MIAKFRIIMTAVTAVLLIAWEVDLGWAAKAKVRIALQHVAGGFNRPVDLEMPDDGTGRFFVVEQPGTIKIIQDGAVLAQNFLDIHGKVTSGSETGLLGLTFHPGFAGSGRFYLNYTRTFNEQLQTVIAEYQVSSDPNVADSTSERVLLTVDQPFDNHNAGQLAFGPDGFLYFGLGDGGSGGDPLGNGQNLETLLGKMLRIDVDHQDSGMQYAIPADNPFATSDVAEHEIWAYGFRNPWRFSFDRDSGQLFCADVGQARLEEIDIVQKGGNYGWNVMEGKHCFNPKRHCDKNGKILPIAQYKHTVGIAIIGGYVYKGAAIPALANMYIFGDYGSGRIWFLRNPSPTTYKKKLLIDTHRSLSSFGQDAAGEVYVVDLDGEVLEIVPR